MEKKRTIPIQLYLNEGERKLLEELAWRERLSMSKLLRKLLKNSAESQDLWPSKEKELA